jgi:uncharacterized protein
MLLAAAAAFAGASVQSATGFGFALLLSPALFAVLDPYEAVTALLALGLLLNLLVLGDGGVGPVHGRAVVPLLFAALPGLVLGAALLAWLSKPTLQIVVGMAVLLAAAVQWRGRARAAGRDQVSALPEIELEDDPTRASPTLRSPAPTSEARSHLVPMALVGFTSGVLSTSVGVSGPPLVLWLERRDLRPVEVRATLAAIFLALNLVGGAVVLVGGGARSVELDVLLPLLALVLAGHVVGSLAFRRLDARSFARLTLAVVALAGVASIAAGAAAS